MAINNAKSFLVTLLIFAMVLSPSAAMRARVQGLDRVLLQGGPICPTCVSLSLLHQVDVALAFAPILLINPSSLKQRISMNKL
ncbi:hypothetical protein Patl1_33903 [Pistacia atlantica]|uniref:Uncharacterized protein n=1 Tax=Pistacia atlantica TaxID=434234 RepID=A0ACC0ZRU0_9ROSI|nr:hypothetical protein Patl1_33903 [Pistacia atlantica]